MNSRISRETESIIDKGPIVLTSDAPKGYTGIRTTIQIRDFRSSINGADRDFILDAVINTEVRKGPHAGRNQSFQEQVTTDHHDAIGLLLTAIQKAQDEKKIGD